VEASLRSKPIALRHQRTSRLIIGAAAKEMRVLIAIIVGFAFTTIVMFAVQALGYSVGAFFHGGGFIVGVALASVVCYWILGRLRWFRNSVQT
jgi:membrane associated rhomboid family serine protease